MTSIQSRPQGVQAHVVSCDRNHLLQPGECRAGAERLGQLQKTVSRQRKGDRTTHVLRDDLGSTTLGKQQQAIVDNIGPEGPHLSSGAHAEQATDRFGRRLHMGGKGNVETVGEEHALFGLSHGDVTAERPSAELAYRLLYAEAQHRLFELVRGPRRHGSIGRQPGGELFVGRHVLSQQASQVSRDCPKRTDP